MHNTIRRNGKRLMAMVLIVLIILSTFPITSFAASANLGEVSGADKIDVTAEMNYGHEIHYGTVNGNKYPLFVLNTEQHLLPHHILREKKQWQVMML